MRCLFIAGAILFGCGGTASESPGNGSSTGGNGGASGSSGTGGSAGTGGTGGGVPEDCGSELTFRLTSTPAASTPNFCLGKPGSCGGGGAWLTILDAAGQAIYTYKGCQLVDCADCEPTGCPAICAQSTPLSDEGVESAWSGVAWTAGQTCGDDLQCVTPACAAPGSYTARFCAHAVTSASGAGGADSFSWCEDNAEANPTCVDVPFELPSSATIEGVLEPG